MNFYYKNNYLIILLVFFVNTFAVIIYFLYKKFEVIPGRFISCQVGEINEFKVFYNSYGKASISLVADKMHSFHLELKGNVKETCINKTEDFITLKLDFAEVNFFSMNQLFPLNSNGIFNDKKNIYLKILKSGKVHEIHFHKELNSTLSNVIRDYIVNSYVDFSNYSDQNLEWENSYVGYNENIVFKYIYNNFKINRFFNDSNVENNSFKRNAKKIHKKYLEGSFTNFELDKYNIPLIVNMKRLSQTFLGSKVLGDEETIFKKEHLKRELVNFFNNEKSTYYSNPNSHYVSDLSAPEVDERLNHKILVEKMKFKSFNEFLEKVNLNDKSLHTDYFLHLKSLFKLEKNSVQDAMRFLTDINELSDAFMLVVSALTATNTSESQNALIETFKGINNTQAKMSIIANLGIIETPTIETEEFIRSLTQQENIKFKNTAILAIGNIGRHLLPLDSKREKRIYNELTFFLKSSNSIIEKKISLLSLGNLSDERSLETFYKETKSKSDIIRQSATFALRFIDKIDVDIYLRSILENETSDKVKVAALQAISFRKVNSETINLQKNILRNDSSEIVRMEALKNLSEAGIKDELIYAKENDSSKSIRTYAENLLARFLVEDY